MKLTSTVYRRIEKQASDCATQSADRHPPRGLQSYTDLWGGLFRGYKAGYRAAMKRKP